MANLPRLENHVREQRLRRGWSQEELARRSGLSRAGVSAIETERLVPSAAAALALAEALGCRVEGLFRLPRRGGDAAAWVWAPPKEPCRYWQALFDGQTRYFPVEASPLGMVPHDGVYRADAFDQHAGGDPAKTLVLASCDPAGSLLADELARSSGIRLILLPRSSETALALLKQGLVHAAGVHLARADTSGGNGPLIRDRIGPGYRLMHVALWEEGITHAPAQRIHSVREAVRGELRWVGREPGSGARRCLDELLGERHAPRRMASDHRGVAEAVRSGWADVGVCLRLVSEEAGLDFLSVRHEAYDLCFAEAMKADPRIQALIAAVRSTAYRRSLGELPGYDPADAGRMDRLG